MNKVGITTRAFTEVNRTNWDGTGSRSLVTDLWYPAIESAVEQDISIGPPDAPLLYCCKAAPDADLLPQYLTPNTQHPIPNSFPLILLSHGTGGSARSIGWLAEALARQGYIVAGANHHGNTAIEPYRVEGFAHVWERPRDMSVILDLLLQDPQFGPRIDRERIGAAGFSLGGYTALALAGARLNLASFIQSYTDAGRDMVSDLPPEFSDAPVLAAHIEDLAANDTTHKQSFRDERLRAIFAIAPAIGQGLTPESLATITVPVRIVVGESDTSAPPDAIAQYIASYIPQANLTILPGAVAHYTFLAEATPHGKKILPDITIDAPDVDRAAIHRTVGQWAVEFFDEWVLSVKC